MATIQQRWHNETGKVFHKLYVYDDWFADQIILAIYSKKLTFWKNVLYQFLYINFDLWYDHCM